MKLVFGRITAAIFIASSIAACSSQPGTSQVTGNVQVLAPMNTPYSDNVGVQTDTASPGYTLQFIELTGITNLTEVAGNIVRFFMSPRIIDNHLDGAAPQGRFIKNHDGKYIPTNDLTQELVTVYAHMQKLSQLDVELGAGGINKWPRDIGVGVHVTGGMDNNAFYDGATDSMLFVPYSYRSGLPIAVNAGILAHEHFHSLFYKTVLISGVDQQTSIHNRDEFLANAGIKDSTQLIQPPEDVNSPLPLGDKDELHTRYHHALIRGMNEGLADFWGWMYTGDPDFIATSLPNEKSARTLRSTQLSINSLSSVERIKGAVMVFAKTQDALNRYLTNYAYTIGTEFSRFMKKFTDIYAGERGLDSLDARKEVAKLVVKILPLLNTDFTKTKDGSYYDPSQFAQSLASQIPDLKKAECDYLVGTVSNTSLQATASCVADGDAWKLVVVRAAQ